jgi:hypothetical protein
MIGLTPSCTISLNHIQLQQLIMTASDPLHSRSRSRSLSLPILILFISVLPQLPASELDSFISTLHGPHGKQPVLLTKPVYRAVA